MALVTTQPASVEMAIGQAAMLLATAPAYFDIEFAPVMFRLAAAAETRQIVFLQETDTRQIVGFASYAFLAPDAAVAWRHRMRSPSRSDMNAADGECWLVDVSYASKEMLELLVSAIKARHGAKAAIIKSNMPVRSYPDYPVITFK